MRYGIGMSRDISASPDFDRAVDALRRARRITVLSGAGASAESGIPTFRDALTGLWSTFDAEQLATPDAFLRDPDLVWGWYEWRRGQVARVQPNAGHFAVAQLGAIVPAVTVVTQNVDDLHERAGSTGVLHLHGSIAAPRCFDCARPWPLPADLPDEPEGGRRLPPPRYTHCGGMVRPGVVWFGEALPRGAWQRAEHAISGSDLVLVIGTSGIVYPAAELPERALAAGTPVIEFNIDESALSPYVTRSVRTSAAVGLPALLDALGE